MTKMYNFREELSNWRKERERQEKELQQAIEGDKKRGNEEVDENKEGDENEKMDTNEEVEESDGDEGGFQGNRGVDNQSVNL